jgi:2-keto-4-pentenoate hydratase
MVAPKVELELVFKLKDRPLSVRDPLELLTAVEWWALGFEIVDCPYPDWQFTPADLVATFGFHAALIIGDCLEPDPLLLEQLSEQIGNVNASLSKNGEAVATGSGKNVVGHPLLALAHLSEVIEAHRDAPLLQAGEIISTGTMTPPEVVVAGDTLIGELSGVDVPALTIDLVA